MPVCLLLLVQECQCLCLKHTTSSGHPPGRRTQQTFFHQPPHLSTALLCSILSSVFIPCSPPGTHTWTTHTASPSSSTTTPTAWTTRWKVSTRACAQYCACFFLCLFKRCFLTSLKLCFFSVCKRAIPLHSSVLTNSFLCVNAHVSCREVHSRQDRTVAFRQAIPRIDSHTEVCACLSYHSFRHRACTSLTFMKVYMQNKSLH